MDASANNLGRLLVYALIAPLSIWLGLMLATPMSPTSLIGVGLVVFTLCVPLLLRWHHALVIGFWNAVVVIPFLPGQPSAWILLAGLSLGIAITSRTMRHQSDFIWVRGVAIPLLLLAAVVVGTAITRGVGSRALGSEMWGAKRYLSLFGAIIGYFALTARAVPPRQATWFAGLFFLSGMTAIFSDLAFAGGRAFYWLFLFFPTDLAFNQAMSADTLRRFTGMAWMAQAGYWFMLLRYGIRGMLDPRRLWRLILFLSLFMVGLLGGFRSSIILFGILFVTQFWFERLFRTRWFFVVALGGLIMGAFLVGFAERLPLSVQRSLSFLPTNVHPAAQQDAAGTLDWRLQMWRVVVPEIPQYLWVGKGYTFSGTEYSLMQEAIRKGLFTAYEDTLVSGNYHNGLLTLLVPFGLPGTLAFTAFIIAGWRVLRRNYLYGPASMQRVNTFLIAYFTARLVFYLVFYGQFDLDLMVFTGVVGLSLSLNGGIHAPPTVRPVPLRPALPAPAK
ncbi:MAG: O-antigen ligase domain-containing protein [Proteobacteria bacterium]|nr:O-antigen ligase domain-containing protein [Pseudomonadota bacterium]